MVSRESEKGNIIPLLHYRFGVQGRDYRGIMFSCSLLITSYLKGFRFRRAVDSGEGVGTRI